MFHWKCFLCTKAALLQNNSLAFLVNDLNIDSIFILRNLILSTRIMNGEGICTRIIIAN